MGLVSDAREVERSGFSLVAAILMVAGGKRKFWCTRGGHRNCDCLETQVVVECGVGGNSNRGELELRRTHFPG
jgi:hypothetical protein